MDRNTMLWWVGLLCLVSLSYAEIVLPFNLQCASAKLNYWQKNADVAQYTVDAVRHYEISGYAEGRGNWTTTYGAICSRLSDYVNSSSCQCSASVTRYINLNPAAATYPGGAWAHYLANAPGNSGIWWPCELCFVNSTCDCWQSRVDYWNNNPDVAAQHLDSLFFYSTYGRKNATRPTLNCNLCNSAPILMNTTSSLCNCITAQNDYLSRYSSIMSTSYQANPFSHYLAFSRMMGTAWNCSLCDTDTSTPADPALNYITTSQTCLGARLAYLAQNSDVAGAQVDAVHHYQYSGHAEGRPWHSEYCNTTFTGVNNVYSTDAAAQCDAANNDYANRYKDVAPGNAWRNFYRNILQWGRVYNAQLCSTAVLKYPQTLKYLTHECTCMAARILYWQQYPDVFASDLDPVVHYETQHDRTWDCSPCNATSLYFIDDVWSTGCANASATYAAVPHSETSTYYSPFLAWWNYRYLLNKPWHSEGCYTPIGNTILPSYQPMQVAYGWKFHSASALSGWTSAPWATLTTAANGYNGNPALNITVPVPTGTNRPATSLIEFDGINIALLRGANIMVTCNIKTINVSVPQASYNGIKLVFYMLGNTSGEETWNNAYLVGTNDWNSTNYQYFFTVYNDAILASMSIGLQDSSGTILVDSLNITVFRPGPTPLPTPNPNAPPPYTGHDYVPRFRGIMSPVTYVDADIQNVGVNWKANLIRWQLNWDTASNDDRNNLTLYDQWLNSKLNETDYLLQAAVKYGMKVVIDLHTTPGGQDSRGQYFLLMATYQNHFLQVWNNISLRYKGNQAVWGYDLANEPLQWLPGDAGVLQWQQLVELTTQNIRKIDSQVTIIIESEYGGSQDGFNWLRPVNDDKVVYSMHMYAPQGFTFQGAPASGFPLNNAVYPGMVEGVYTNITTLRQFLAPVRAFQLAFNTRIYTLCEIYIGEFSAVRWALNNTAINYINDCMTIFEQYGWDYTYHSYREYQGFSVEYDESIHLNLISLSHLFSFISSLILSRL